jgi:LPS sulfotransferase NodH
MHMDFIEPRFDNEEVYTGPTAEVMVLSTPRSGSTAVCSLLHNNGIGTPHEYFQPYQYLPALARRVGLTEVNQDNLHRITAFLRTRRSRGGWFSYNIHSSHHSIWSAFGPSLEAAGMMDGSVLLYCRRADLMGQTASYYIAHRIHQWGNLGVQEDETQCLEQFDEALCVRLHRSLILQTRAAEEIFQTQARRFHSVAVIEFEQTWTERFSTIAGVLPIHMAKISTQRSDPSLKTMVLEQMRACPALIEMPSSALSAK